MLRMKISLKGLRNFCLWLLLLWFAVFTILLEISPKSVLIKSILEYFSQWSNVFSAITAITLAVAAFSTIYENQRSRAEDRDLEFKKRLLEQILNWTQETRKRCFKFRDFSLGAFQLSRDLQEMLVEGSWAEKTAEIFSSELKSNIVEANGRMRALIGASVAVSQIPQDPLNALVQSLNKILESIFEIKKNTRL